MPDKIQLATARCDAAFRTLEQSSIRQSQQGDTVAKLRLEFFDRIVLLNGGTIALSVTFVGALISKDLYPLKVVSLLIISWSAFLLSMVLGLTRNWLEHNRLSSLEFNNYILAVNEWTEANFGLADALVGSSQETRQARQSFENAKAIIEPRIEQNKVLLRSTQVAGAFSLLFSVIAFVLLLVFAAKNVPTVHPSASRPPVQNLRQSPQ